MPDDHKIPLCVESTTALSGTFWCSGERWSADLAIPAVGDEIILEPQPGVLQQRAAELPDDNPYGWTPEQAEALERQRKRLKGR